MLTPREREVMTHVVAGRLNKQIAGDLGTVEKTVKVHRGRVMASSACARSPTSSAWPKRPELPEAGRSLPMRRCWPWANSTIRRERSR